MKYHFLLFSGLFFYVSSAFSMDATPPRPQLQRSQATINLIPDAIRLLLQQYAEKNNSTKINSVDPKYQLHLKRLDPTTPPGLTRTRSNSLSKSQDSGHYGTQISLPRSYSLQATPDSLTSPSSGTVIEIDSTLVEELVKLVQVHGSDSIENQLTEEQRKIFEKAKSESPRINEAQAAFVARKHSSTSDLCALQRAIPNPTHKPNGLVNASSPARRTPVRRNSLLGDSTRPQSPLRNSSDNSIDTDQHH